MTKIEWSKSSEVLELALERYEEKVRSELLSLIAKEMEVDTYHLSFAIKQYAKGFLRHHKENPKMTPGEGRRPMKTRIKRLLL